MKESFQCVNEVGSKRNIIKEFLYIFGTQTTTNHDLKRYAKMLKIKNFHVVMTNEVQKNRK